MAIHVSGGGGGLPPGVTGNGQTPGGLNVAGEVTLGNHSLVDVHFHRVWGGLEVVADQAEYESGDSALVIEQYGTLDAGEGQPQIVVVVDRYIDRNGITPTNAVLGVSSRDASGGTNPVTAGEPVFSVNEQEAGEVTINKAGGVGVFGHAPPTAQSVLATGAGHTVDDVITLLQSYGLCKQS